MHLALLSMLSISSEICTVTFVCAPSMQLVVPWIAPHPTPLVCMYWRHYFTVCALYLYYIHHSPVQGWKCTCICLVCLRYNYVISSCPFTIQIQRNQRERQERRRYILYMMYVSCTLIVASIIHGLSEKIHIVVHCLWVHRKLCVMLTVCRNAPLRGDCDRFPCLNQYTACTYAVHALYIN